jgi:DNA-binding NarL/FixJ family response regulator
MAFPGCLVVEAATEAESVALIMSQSPHVVVIDSGLSASKQLAATRHLKQLQPSLQIVIWSAQDWKRYRTDALAAGASAYVLKEETQDNLLDVLTAMLAT